MKRVMKRNNRSKTIWEFRDEGLFLNIESPAVPSCRVMEQSMVLCLLVLLGTICFEILANWRLLLFRRGPFPDFDFWFFGAIPQNLLIFIYHEAI